MNRRAVAEPAALAGRTVAIDVTPVLPGGANGGAKHFVLELLSGLAESEPHAKFVLLTHPTSYEELSVLDGPNVRRVLVADAPRSQIDGHAGPPGTIQSLRLLYGRCYPLLPAVARRGLARLAYQANGWIKRGRGSGLPSRLGADVLFCPFTAPTFHERGIPTVCTLYDLQFAAYPQFFDDADFAYRRSVTLDAARKAAMLVAISDFSRDAAIAYAGIDPNRIESVYLRMARRFGCTSAGGANLLARLGLAPGNYLIYPANFWRHKQHEMLLTAFGMACSNGLPRGIRLVLTGAPGRRQEFLRGAARAMGFGDRVVFPGYVDDEDLAILLEHARGLVFPSLYEGFGLPILEAMAAEVPVACSNSTALAEIASDAALLFDPRKPVAISHAILRLVLDCELRQDLIARGRVRARAFSARERMIDDYRRLIAQVIERSAAGHHSRGSART